MILSCRAEMYHIFLKITLLWMVSRGVVQDHVHCHFVWCNAKSFYCFSLWEKAAVCFQFILKHILHEKYRDRPCKGEFSNHLLEFSIKSSTFLLTNSLDREVIWELTLASLPLPLAHFFSLRIVPIGQQAIWLMRQQWLDIR